MNDIANNDNNIIQRTPSTWYDLLFVPCFFLLVILEELILRIFVVSPFLDVALVYILVFSLIVALIHAGIIGSLPTRFKSIYCYIISIITFLIYASQSVYYNVFATYYSAFSVSKSSQITDYYREILIALGNTTLQLILLALPIIALFILVRRLSILQRPANLMSLSLFPICALITVAYLIPIHMSDDIDSLSPKGLIFNTHNLSASVDNLGLMQTMYIDFSRFLFGFEEKNILADNLTSTDSSTTAMPSNIASSNSSVSVNSTDVGSSISSNEVNTVQSISSNVARVPNILPIDFDALIAGESDETIRSMHEYFANKPPTYTNDKTGLYKGYNLIFITAEGFSHLAIDKDLTPTLYKMYSEGYTFDNFYNPIWSVSTSDGEYTTTQSLIPKSGVWSMSKSSDNYLPFTMGNQLSRLGYSTYAYHNHTATYYDRHLSHPNLGYIFKAQGAGLDMEKHWPESDLEMIQETVPDYIHTEPFHAYYMTVSGHLYYNFKSNYQSYQHQDAVAHLEYSSDVRAYLACNLELELAMTELLKSLEEAGVADHTLIAISADHYPYGLTLEQTSELAGHPVEEHFELYRNAFLLYTPNMEHEVITEPACSMDIIPTLSNLLGLPYDSRLMMGRDIFSDSPPFVIFSNRGFIAEDYRFQYKGKKTIPTGDRANIPEDEVRAKRKDIDTQFYISAAILDHDYYSYIKPYIENR